MELQNVIEAFNDSANQGDSKIVSMTSEQIDMVNGSGSGWVYSLSGECNSSGASCNVFATFSHLFPEN